MADFVAPRSCLPRGSKEAGQSCFIGAKILCDLRVPDTLEGSIWQFLIFLVLLGIERPGSFASSGSSPEMESCRCGFVCNALLFLLNHTHASSHCMFCAGSWM